MLSVPQQLPPGPNRFNRPSRRVRAHLRMAQQAAIARSKGHCFNRLTAAAIHSVLTIAIVSHLTCSQLVTSLQISFIHSFIHF